VIDKRSLHPIASPGGVICLPALDHREAMRNAFRRAGVEDVNANAMLETKSRIVEAVGSAATGVLLDFVAARVSRPDGIGLLVPLEEQGHEQLDGARLNRLEFTAEDALWIGADGCKLLLHYRPDHLASAQRQREVVAHAADDCHRQGLSLVLEPLVYRLDGESEGAHTNAFADLVVRSASDLADSGADILKLQYPGDFAACRRLTVAASPLRWVLLGGQRGRRRDVRRRPRSRVPRRRLGLHGRSHDLGRCTRSRPDGPAVLAGRTCPTTIRTPLRDCP